MIVSMSKPAEAPANNTTTKPEAANPRVRVSRKGGKLVVDIKAPAARSGTKTAKIIRMLQRPAGASLAELTRATKWQPHSVRGFLSGAVKGKRHLKVISKKRADGERAYRVPSK